MNDSSTPAADPGDGAEDAAWYGSATPAHRPADADKVAWRAYFEATQLLTEALERDLKQHCGLTLSDYNLLLLLAESDTGRLRLGELASRMVFSPSRVTYLVTSLSQRGLVERVRAENDRRGYDACLTDAGRSAFRRAAARHARQVDELFLGRLEPGEAEVLTRVFSRVGHELDARR